MNPFSTTLLPLPETEGLLRLDPSPSPKLKPDYGEQGQGESPDKESFTDGDEGGFFLYTPHFRLPTSDFQVSVNASIAPFPSGRVETNAEGEGDPEVIQPSEVGIASVLRVTNTNNSGPGSLRRAIAIANSNPGEDTIFFDPNLRGQTINLNLSFIPFEITDALIIQGLGADQLTISGGGTVPVFTIDNGDSYNLITVKIDGLTIADGFGGGIFNREDLTITRSVIANNSGGSGIYNYFGNLTIFDSSITNNSGGRGILTSDGEVTITNSTITDNFGGGIRNYRGTMTLNSSTISGNTATDGGGIYNSDSYTKVILVDSTISGNTAFDEGGGIYNRYYSDIVLINSTVSGNSAGREGGGISSRTSASVSITNSTIADNSAPSGGGLLNYFSDVELSNTIIAGNPGGDVVQSGFGGIFNLQGVNLVQDSSLTGFYVLNVNPLLGPLRDNGGPTQTHALSPSSPAIDGGNNSVVRGDTPFDQRGAGVPRIVNGQVDLGSFEAFNIMGTNGDDVLTDTAANDVLIGNSGNDLLSGSVGNDSFIGGRGLDTLQGGLGLDTFVVTGLNNDADQIDNFTPGQDQIVLTEVFQFFDIRPSSYEELVTAGILRFFPLESNVRVGIDPDGFAGDGSVSLAALVKDITVEELNDSQNFVINSRPFANPPQSVIVVDTLVDENDGNVNAGDLSLREALQIVSPGGKITFAPTLAGGVITLTQGQLLVDRPVTIQGLGAEQITISGNNSSRVFLIDGNDGDNRIDVTFDGLTIANGYSSAGGGIFNQENLTLINSILRQNVASLSSGGGIVSNGPVTITYCTISNNSAKFDGGGITLGPSSTSILMGNTITENFANNGGGVGNNGNLTMINNTISGNSSRYESGGFRNFAFGNATLINNTISNNTNDGITSFGTLRLSNNIVAYSSNGLDVDNRGVLSTAGVNLVEDGSITGVNVINADPLLGLLADNGGPTLTQTLLAGSPAIDAGDNLEVGEVLTDQRGFARIVDGNSDGIAVVDLGAVELFAAPPLVI